MYIRRVEINNIRSIEHFEMTFPEGKEAGWHVLIGDNGSGKSTIVRSVALALLDYGDIVSTNQDWDEWLRKGKHYGEINLSLFSNEHPSGETNEVQNRITFDRQGWEQIVPEARADIFEVIFRGRKSFFRVLYPTTSSTTHYPTPTLTPAFPSRPLEHWFSAGYGPFRRFTGGDRAKERAYTNNPNLGAHLSIFGEDVALSEALTYIKNLYTRSLEYNSRFRANEFQDRQNDALFYELLLNFINEAKLLPHGAEISGVTTDGVYFKDGNGRTISAVEMSDGYRSILSMTFELIRQFVRVFGTDSVIADIQANQQITLPGVVLIDEVDAHLHPTWQTDIGQWFTKYFPNIQFIVTTHSPLVCRAADKGTIWRLPTPGSGEVAQEITGDEKKRLVFGNVLDAYGTNAFGDNVARSESANDKLNELAELNIKSIMGQISPDEEQQLNELRSIFPTEG